VAELGRIGGRSKRFSFDENLDPLPTLSNAIAIRDTVSRLIADVYAGTLHPRIASGLAPLINVQLRAIGAIDAMDLVQRLVQFEERLTKAEERLARKRAPIGSQTQTGDVPRSEDDK